MYLRPYHRSSMDHRSHESQVKKTRMSWQDNDADDYTIGHMSLNNPEDPASLPKSVLSSLIKTSKMLVRIKSRALSLSAHSSVPVFRGSGEDIRAKKSMSKSMSKVPSMPSIKEPSITATPHQHQEHQEHKLSATSDEGHPLTLEESLHNITHDLHTDETIALFQCMPKGYDYFLNNGTPKTLHEKMEYNKLQLNHNRIADELKQLREQADTRWAALANNDCSFREDIVNFEPNLDEITRRTEKALTSAAINQRQKDEYQGQLEKLIKELSLLEQHHKKLLKVMPKCEGFSKFSANLVKVSAGKYKCPRDVMERHTTLNNSLAFQLNRFFRGREILDEVQDLNEELSKSHLNNMSDLKKQLMEDKIHLHKLRNDNKDLANGLQKCEITFSQQQGDNAALESALTNIFNFMMNYRHFTRKQMSKCETDLERIDVLGHIILDYNMLIDEYNAEKIREARRMTRKSLGTRSRQGSIFYQ